MYFLKPIDNIEDAFSATNQQKYDVGRNQKTLLSDAVRRFLCKDRVAASGDLVA